MARAIDGDELLGITRLLDTDVVRQSKTASWLLDQVLHDIQAMPTLTPPNEPLTMEQLREMDGQPVYDAKHKKWHVIEAIGNCFVEMTDGAIFDSDIWYGNLTDRLYRRPPEGDEDA